MPKRKKPNDINNTVHALQACIEADHNKLEVLHKRIVADIKKNVNTTSKLLNKTRKQVAKLKKAKKKSPKTYQAVLAQVQLIKSQLKALKDEKATALLEFKKFIEKQKLLSKFEMQWKKKSSISKLKTRKLKPRVKKKRSVDEDTESSNSED